jgi:hypothetical protein
MRKKIAAALAAVMALGSVAIAPMGLFANVAQGFFGDEGRVWISNFALDAVFNGNDSKPFWGNVQTGSPNWLLDSGSAGKYQPRATGATDNNRGLIVGEQYLVVQLPKSLAGMYDQVGSYYDGFKIDYEIIIPRQNNTRIVRPGVGYETDTYRYDKSWFDQVVVGGTALDNTVRAVRETGSYSIEFGSPLRDIVQRYSSINNTNLLSYDFTVEDWAPTRDDRWGAWQKLIVTLDVEEFLPNVPNVFVLPLVFNGEREEYDYEQGWQRKGEWKHSLLDITALYGETATGRNWNLGEATGRIVYGTDTVQGIRYFRETEAPDWTVKVEGSTDLGRWNLNVRIDETQIGGFTNGGIVTIIAPKGFRFVQNVGAPNSTFKIDPWGGTANSHGLFGDSRADVRFYERSFWTGTENDTRSIAVMEIPRLFATRQRGFVTYSLPIVEYWTSNIPGMADSEIPVPYFFKHESWMSANWSIDRIDSMLGIRNPHGESWRWGWQESMMLGAWWETWGWGMVRGVAPSRVDQAIVRPVVVGNVPWLIAGRHTSNGTQRNDNINAAQDGNRSSGGNTGIADSGRVQAMNRTATIKWESKAQACLWDQGAIFVELVDKDKNPLPGMVRISGATITRGNNGDIWFRNTNQGVTGQDWENWPSVNLARYSADRWNLPASGNDAQQFASRQASTNPLRLDRQSSYAGPSNVNQAGHVPGHVSGGTPRPVTDENFMPSMRHQVEWGRNPDNTFNEKMIRIGNWEMASDPRNRGNKELFIDVILEIDPNWCRDNDLDEIYLLSYMGQGDRPNATPIKVADVTPPFFGTVYGLNTAVGYGNVSYNTIVIQEVTARKLPSNTNIHIAFSESFFGERRPTSRIHFGAVSPARINEYIDIVNQNGTKDGIFSISVFEVSTGRGTTNRNILNRAGDTSDNRFEPRYLRFVIGGESSGDNRSTMTVKGVPVFTATDVNPAGWWGGYVGQPWLHAPSDNEVFMIAHMFTGNSAHHTELMNLHHSFGYFNLLDDAEHGANRFAITNFGWNHDHGSRGTNAWGYIFTNVEEETDTHVSLAPVVELEWSADGVMSQYKQNGTTVAITDESLFPFLEAGTWYVPVRLFAQMFGIPEDNLTWGFDPLVGATFANVDASGVDGIGRRLTFSDGDPIVMVADGFGSSYMMELRDNNDVPVKAKIVNGRFFVPLRAGANLFGFTVDGLQDDNGNWIGGVINAR